MTAPAPRSTLPAACAICTNGDRSPAAPSGPLHYLLMEFVDGGNLRQIEQAGRLTPEQAVGTCELCFPGATEEEIAACAVELDTDALEAPVLRELGGGQPEGPTLVALALT